MSILALESLVAPGCNRGAAFEVNKAACKHQLSISCTAVQLTTAH